MRIVHIAYSYNGGAGRAAWRLHEALLQAGFDSWFLTADEAPPANNLNWCKIDVNRQWTNPGKLDLVSWLRLRRRNRLKQACKSVQKKLAAECSTHPFSRISLWKQDIVKSADIVNLHWITGGLLDYADFFEHAKKPLVWTLHDEYAFLGFFHYKNDMIANRSVVGRIEDDIVNFKRKAMAMSKTKIAIVTPSEWLRKEAAASVVLRKFPVNRIPYSLNLETYCVFDQKECRSKLGLPENGLVFLFVADSLSNFRKGFDLLKEALAKHSYDYDITLVAIGKPSGLSIGKHRLIEAGIISEEAKLAQYYNAADAFIIPSREDNLPNVMLESMACGTPVIGFNIGGVGEHVKFPVTGLLAEEVSSEALHMAIKKFVGCVDKFDRATVRKYAVDHFENSIQSSSYFDIYKKLCSKD